MTAVASYFIVNFIIIISNIFEFKFGRIFRGLLTPINANYFFKKTLKSALKQNIKINSSRKIELSFLPLLILIMSYLPFTLIFSFHELDENNYLLKSNLLSTDHDLLIVFFAPLLSLLLLIYLAWATRGKTAIIESFKGISFKLHYILISLISLTPILVDFESFTISKIIEKQSLNGIYSWGIARHPISFLIYLFISIFLINNLDKLLSDKKYFYASLTDHLTFLKNKKIIKSLKLFRLSIAMIIVYLFLGGFQSPIPSHLFQLDKDYNLTMEILLFLTKIQLVDFFMILLNNVLSGLNNVKLDAVVWKLLYPVSYAYLFVFIIRKFYG